jgi:hypothetical protein
MCNFFVYYLKNQILAPLVREISCTLITLLLWKCKDELEHELYIKMKNAMTVS